MSSIADIVGHSNLVSAIEAALNDTEVGVLRLTGPPGSGKSTVALQVGHDWEAAGGTLIVATGDDQQAGRAYFPFLLGLVDASADWRKVIIQGSRSALKVLDSLEGTGGIASGIFDLLGVAVKQRAERSIRMLTTLEREILADLRRYAKGRKILLIADNFHWWDKASIALLEQFRSPLLSKSIPELKDIKVLLVDTAGEQKISDEESFDRVRKSANATFTSTLCDRAEYGALLAAFGVLEALPTSVTYSLYALTGGHLKVTQQLAAYLADHDVSEIDMDVGGSDRLISMRLLSLGAEAPLIEACLRVASLIGLSFDVRELACATDIPLSRLKTLLTRAEDLYLLEGAALKPRFAHDVLRTFFLHGQSPEILRNGKRGLQNCIAKLRPGDYDLRSKLLIEAGDTSSARDLFALAAAQHLRDGGPIRWVLSNAQETFASDAALVEWIQAIASGYSAIASGNHALGFSTVSSGPFEAESMLMGAERYYVAAICAMELQTQEGFDDSLRLLETWIPRTQDEVELSLRMRLLVQQVHVLAGNTDKARTIEADLEADLLERAAYDTGAVELLQIQNRRAASVHSPEIALQRIERAVKYYSTDNGSVRRVIGRYKALSNLTGVLIQLGRYDTAHTVALQAEALVVGEPNVDFPRKDVFGHNLVLASVRCGKLSPGEGAKRQCQIVDSPEGRGDNFLQRSNLAAYLLLDGQIDAASDLLDDLNFEAEQRRFTEAYLLYYVKSLRTACLLLEGNIIQARLAHESLGDFVATLRWTTAPYLRRRYGLWARIIADDSIDRSQPELDRLVTMAYPKEVGPCWDHNSRLMPCVELAFWSDA